MTMRPEIHEFRELYCPHCSRRVYGHASLEPGHNLAPVDGDVGMCDKCRGWWQIKDNLMVAYAPSVEEVAEVQKAERRSYD